MPKLSRSLTEKQIEHAKPSTTLADGKGLALVVSANLNKRWIFRYTRPDGRKNMIGFGSYPDVSSSSARKKAADARLKVEQGIDPGDEVKQSKVKIKTELKGSFKLVAESWYAFKAQSWAPETARKVRECLTLHLYPKLQYKQITAITTADIKPILRALHESSPRVAQKAREYCNQIIDYAIQEGLREDGRYLTLRGILPRPSSKHFPAVTKSNELPKMIKIIRGIDSLQTRTAILLCLYTASRPGVVVAAEWSELDLEAKEWHIPASKMKAEHDHITPLPKQIIQAIEQLKGPAGESPYVFVSIRKPETRHMHRDTLSSALREKGLRGVTVTHGFRATFRTIARERLRADADVLEAQLAHAKKDMIQKAYDRTQFLDERHILIQQWADYLDAMEAGGKIVPIAKSKTAA